MQDVEAAMTLIHRAFDPAVYPGDAWLIGSRDGCEPEDEVGPFRGNIVERETGFEPATSSLGSWRSTN
jgi:hypothetical protein